MAHQHSIPSLWQSALWQRFVYLWWAKGILSTGVLYGFFILYFYLLKNPAYTVTPIPSMRVDEWVDFSPEFFWVYASLWVYVSLPIAFLINIKEARVLSLGLGGVSAMGLMIFYIWPTKIVSTVVPVDLQSGAYVMLKSLDTAGNSCPSLHVATAVYAGIWLYDLLHHMDVPKRIHAVNVVWCIAIVYSTMAIKQHVFLDVLGGLLLALCFAWRWRLARVLSINFK